MLRRWRQRERPTPAGCACAPCAYLGSNDKANKQRERGYDETTTGRDVAPGGGRVPVDRLVFVLDDWFGAAEMMLVVVEVRSGLPALSLLTIVSVVRVGVVGV